MWLSDLWAQQAGLMDIEVWMEPFAGGAGAGLTLLDRDVIDELWLVDANPAIAAFWASVIAEGDALAEAVARTTPTLSLYEKSREMLAAADAGEVEDAFGLGYAAFIVNRCSRSGIVAPTSSVMGGLRQDGAHTLADRFNAEALADRIRHIHTMRSRIRVTHGDGIAHIEGLDGSCGIEDELVLFVDPPYIREGNRLYASGMSEAAHRRLAAALRSSPTRWMLTYDDEPVVRDDLYPTERVISYDIRNTANKARVAREFAVFSDTLDLRDLSTSLLRYGSGAFVPALVAA